MNIRTTRPGMSLKEGSKTGRQSSEARLGSMYEILFLQGSNLEVFDARTLREVRIDLEMDIYSTLTDEKGYQETAGGALGNCYLCIDRTQKWYNAICTIGCRRSKKLSKV